MARLTKVCSKCKERKSLSDFYKDKNMKDGLSFHCKNCRLLYYRKNKQRINKKTKEYKDQHPRKLLGYRLKSTYNMTVDEYDKLLEEQNKVCAICGKKKTSKNRYGAHRLGVDHNHITNKNRGLLCTHCNTAIGSLIKQTAYGITAQAGFAGTNMAIRYLKLAIRSTLIQDPRVESVDNMIVLLDSDTLNISMNIGIVGVEQSLPVTKTM